MDSYFFLKKPCSEVCPPAPFLSPPEGAALLILGFLSLSIDVDDPVRDGAVGGAVLTLAGCDLAAGLALPVDLAGSVSDSPEYDSSVS